MKSLARQGVGIDKRQTNVISIEQEEALWEKGVLGEDTPEQLLDTLVYLIGLNCALRAGDEHRNLRVEPNSQFQLISDSNGKTFLKYTEDVSKTNRGGLNSRKCERKTIRMVRLFEKYMSLRPKNGKCKAFYLRPLNYSKDNVWYADAAVGKHPLRSTVSNICKKAGFQGFFSNHSLRATAATRLYDSGLDEQLIAERTGHRSLAIRSYKRTSGEMEDRVSSVIRGKSLKCATSVTKRSTAESMVTAPARTENSNGRTEDTRTVAQSTPASASERRDFKVNLLDGTVVSMSF